MNISNHLISWLMEGDPAIRWQTMRDLQNATSKRWKVEQRRTLDEGWGAQLLELQARDGSWGGGIYTPKWTSTTYTLLTLCDIGIPRDHQPAQKAAELTISKLLGSICDDQFRSKLAACVAAYASQNHITVPFTQPSTCLKECANGWRLLRNINCETMY